LSDFLLKMLTWYPKDRATAKEMVSHPWLTMPDDYEYRMTDLQFKKFCLKQKIEDINDQDFKRDKFVNKPGSIGGPAYYSRTGDDCNVSELADSDSEINGGDCEDNLSSCSFQSSESLGGDS